MDSAPVKLQTGPLQRREGQGGSEAAASMFLFLGGKILFLKPLSLPPPLPLSQVSTKLQGDSCVSNRFFIITFDDTTRHSCTAAVITPLLRDAIFSARDVQLLRGCCAPISSGCAERKRLRLQRKGSFFDSLWAEKSVSFVAECRLVIHQVA